MKRTIIFQNLSLSLVALSLISGCSEELDEVPPPVKQAGDSEKAQSEKFSTGQQAAPAANKTADGRTIVDGFSFLVPENWKQVELSSFQKGFVSARFQIVVNDKEITVTLSQSAGGTEANLVRWRGQVEQSRDEVLEKMTIADQPAVLLDLLGRFSPGFGKPPADDRRMLGAIIELGDEGYFVKLTGPADAVKEVEKDFRAFLESAKKA